MANSVYRITILTPHRYEVLVPGRGVPERTRACLSGSTFGGSCLKIGWVGLGLVSMEGDQAADLLLDTAAGEVTPDISPDGDWIAYEASQGGASEVYVRRFPALGDIQTISTDGGRQPLWSPDGRELFYRGPRGMMVVAVLETEPTLRLGDPEVLFDTQYYFIRANRTYDVHPDGQRFLMVKDAPPTDSGVSAQPQIILIENWHQELLERVPVP